MKCSVLLTPLMTDKLLFFKKETLIPRGAKKIPAKIDQRAIERYKQRKLQMLVNNFFQQSIVHAGCKL